MSEERRIQLVAEVDATRAREGLEEIGQQAGQMAASIERSGDRAERAVNGIGAGANQSAARVDAAQRSLIGSIQRTTAQMEAGSRTSARYYEVLAQQRGVNPAALEPYLRQLRAVEQAQQRAGGAAAGAAGSLDRVGASAAQTANALRQVPSQLTDIVTSLQGGQGPLTVLLQQGGQLRDSFGSVGGAIRGVGSQLLGLLNPYSVAAAAAVGLGLAYSEGAKEARLYNSAIATTGNISGTSAEQLADAARQVSEFVGSQREASKVIAELTATGRVANENIAQLAVVATRAQRDLGREIKTTVEEFAALGKAPSEALQELAGKYRGITAATFEQVKALEQQGRATEAATLAQQAHAESIERQRQRVIDSLTDWERGWIRIKTAISGAADATSNWLLNIGRESTAQQKINEGLAVREKLEANLLLAQQRGDVWLVRSTQAALDRNKAEINAARDRLQADKDRAAEEGKAAQREQEMLRIRSQKDTLLSREKQRENELNATRQRSIELNLSAADTETALALVRKKYSDLDEAAKREREAAAKRAAEQMKKEAAISAELAGLTASFADDWKLLSSQYAKGTLSLEQLTAAQAKLLSQQPAMKKATEDEAKDRKAAADAYEQFIKVYDTATKATQTAQDDLQAQKDETAQIGLTTRALAELNAQRLEALAIRAEDKIMAAEGLDISGQLAEKYRDEAAALRERAQEMRDGAARKAVVESAKQAAEDWKRAAESIEQSLTDALLRGFESGKSFGKNLIDTLKNMFNTLVLRPVISAVVNPVAGALSGALGLAGSASAATKGAGAVGAGSGLLSGAGSLSGSFGSGIASGLSAWGAEGSVMGLLQGGGLFSGGIVNGLGTIAGALGPIALGIGAVATVLKKGFGSGPREVTRTSIDGTFGPTGFVGNINETWKKEGGWFVSDKGGLDQKAVSADMVAALNQTYDALKTSTVDFAKTLGVQADYVLTRSQNLSVALTGDQANDQQAIADFFTRIGNDIAVELVPSLAQFTKAGESSSATLQRLATDYAMIDTALSSIGLQFGAIGTASLSARERLIEAAGGLDAFAQNTAGFQQNFLYEAERNAPVLKSVTEQLAAMGLAWIDTRDEFKKYVTGYVDGNGQVVAGLDLTTEAGAKQYGALMKLQAAFAQVYPAVESTADAAKAAAEALAQTNKSYQDQIDEILRSRMSAAEVRALETAGMDATTVALYDRLAALRAETSATEALASVNRTYQDQIDSLLRARMSEVELRALETAGMDASTVALYDRLAALKAEDAAAKTAAEAAVRQRSFWEEAMNASWNVAQNAPKADDGREAQSIASERANIEREILQLQGDTVALRALELAGLDPTNRALKERVFALQDEATAALKAQGILAERKGLQDQLDEVTMTSAQLLEKQRNALDESNKALFDQVQAVKAQKSATEQAAEAIKRAQEAAAASLKSMGDAFVSAIDRAQGAAKALRDFNNSLTIGNLSGLDPEERYREAKKQYEMSGNDTAAVQAFLQASKDRGVDDFFYQRDFAMVRQRLTASISSAEAYAAALPGILRDFYSSIATPAPTPAATPPVVQQSIAAQSVAQADVSRVEAKVDKLIATIGENMDVVASSTAKTAELLDRVTEGGSGMVNA